MKRRRLQGFTIVEIAIVVAIIGLLVSLTLVTFTLVQRQARDDKRSADIAVLKKALEHYYTDNNEYPATTGTFADWQVDSSVKLPPFLVPRYIQAIPLDPTGGGYTYANAYGTTAPNTGSWAYSILVKYETQAPCLQVVRGYTPSGSLASYPLCPKQI